MRVRVETILGGKPLPNIFWRNILTKLRDKASRTPFRPALYKASLSQCAQLLEMQQFAISSVHAGLDNAVNPSELLTFLQQSGLDVEFNILLKHPDFPVQTPMTLCTSFAVRYTVEDFPTQFVQRFGYHLGSGLIVRNISGETLIDSSFIVNLGSPNWGKRRYLLHISSR